MKNKKVMFLIVTCMMIALLVVLIYGFKLRKFKDYNSYLNVDEDIGIVTLGSGSFKSAKNTDEALKIAKEYFDEVNSREKIDFQYKAFSEDEYMFLVTYNLRDEDIEDAKYYMQRLNLELPKENLNIILGIFKSEYYDNDKIYTKNKKMVKTFCDLYTLLRKMDYREIDIISGSNIQEYSEYYIYTANIKNKVSTKSNKGSFVEKTEWENQDIKIYINKQTNEIEYEFNIRQQKFYNEE